MPEMTDEFLIEAVARRLCLFYGGNPDDCYHGGTKPYWKLYENRAADILRVVVPMVVEAAVRAHEDALKECSDDLAELVKSQYPTPIHPSQQRRYDRDMEPVIRARALLAREEKK